MSDAMSHLFSETVKKPEKKGLAMGQERKIHCKDKKSICFTNCGRNLRFVATACSWIFDKLKEKYKCKQCMRKENANL